MNDATLVVVDVTACADWRSHPALAGFATRAEILGSDADATLPVLLRRALDTTSTSSIVVIDMAHVVPSEGLGGLADELPPGMGAVAARILDSSGQRVAFDGGTIDIRRGPLNRADLGPAAVRSERLRSTLWFDPRAFAISRDAAEAIVALPIAPELDALSAGWQIWRAGGSIHVSLTALGRSVDDESSPTATEDEIRVVLGALLEPGTLAASGVQLHGVLERVLDARARLSTPRVRTDTEILAAVGAPPFVALTEPIVIVAPGAADGRRHVYLLCSDSIGPSMAGPGIRSVELARALSDRYDVTVLARRVTGAVELTGRTGELRTGQISEIVGGRDPIVVQGPLTDWFPQILAGTAPVAVDLYDPMNLEALELPDAATHVPYTVRLLVDQVARGDFFLCASERQRDYWLGMLAACGRVDVAAYREDPDLRALIDVVPFGLPGDPPVMSGLGPRDNIDGIGATDTLFVWNGGLWDWFDPDTLLDATALARRSRPDIRVLFMGVQRPGEAAPSSAVRALMRRSDDLGLTGESVFFRAWTPYEERHNTYLQATAAVSLHHAHLESRFSFRTRLLDCIWATVPILGTEGDVLAQLVEEEKLGLTVRPGDVAGVADALIALAEDRHGVVTRARTQLALVAPQFRWDAAVAPLVEWIDRAEPRTRHPAPSLPAMQLSHGPELRWLVAQAHRLKRVVRDGLG